MSQNEEVLELTTSKEEAISGAPVYYPVSPDVGVKLPKVADKFGPFYSVLETEKARRRETELSIRTQVCESMTKIENDLQKEIERRSHAFLELQTKFERDFFSLEHGFHLHIGEMQRRIQAMGETLSTALDNLRSALDAEREQRKTDVEHLARNVVEQVDHCSKRIDDEHISRLEREATLLKQLGADVCSFGEKLCGEQLAREAVLHELRNEISEIKLIRTDEANRAYTKIMEEIAGLKAMVDAERSDRISEDEQIVFAINDYTRALQDGLRIVNTS
mmetsp:Transcript_1315/g.4413  ORF Transcript_1315/g.4413 Transcript_1315/m.4413 type:complete len:277 (+) Transcript_1315:149-979(+)|eukprot:CAMPEP_0183789156 /NCGR_PEP_ID=MMETSP0803_2-20130417/238_1 /TAXON_ID=195967 /ORGANISM="Crustomastix stigmata, Strain CCMP3273" /LENGTH=276 /DNA_ID=CAMNT_0026033317 /DNA_START=149 /DNA_END=979 /DNA_ORIENTATION=-